MTKKRANDSPTDITPTKIDDSGWLKYVDADHPNDLNTPVAVVCDLAWRIASANKTFTAEIARALTAEDPSQSILASGALWKRAVQVAVELAGSAGFGSRGGARLVTNLAKKASKVVTFAKSLVKEGALTPLELQEDRVGFRRGCRILTGLKDGPDAEKRFQRVLPKLAPPFQSGKSYEQYKQHGFTIYEVASLRIAYTELSAKSLRKPYEKTGRYRRGK